MSNAPVNGSKGTPAFPDDLITVTEAAKLLPSRRPGGRLHATTFYRWIRGGKLEGWRVGGVWFVSRRAVLDIPVLAATTPALRSRRERQEQIDAARRSFYAK